MDAVGPRAKASVPGGYVVCPEFLPAVARSLARAGLPLSALVQETSAAEPDIDPESGRRRHSKCVRDALRAGLTCGDAAERYAAESLLTESSASQPLHTKDEPPVGAYMGSLKAAEMRRLVVPGAILLGIDSKQLRTGPGGVTVLDIASCKAGITDDGSSPRAVVEVVIREVAYETSASKDPAAISEPLPPMALRVERICPPDITGPGEVAADCAASWAEMLCRRCASSVFISPVFHSLLSGLLLEHGVEPAILSARSGNARGVFAAKLVALARSIRQTPNPLDHAQRAALFLAAASASSLVTLSATSQDGSADGSSHSQQLPLLLLQGRDTVPAGALVSGVSVDRKVSNGVMLGLGGAPLGRSRQSFFLNLRRLPRSRLPTSMPAEGSLLACLLLHGNASEPGPLEEPVPSLIDSACAELENVLALQVGLSTCDLQVPCGRADRVSSCRSLIQACGASLRVDMGSDGLNVRITGVPLEVKSAAALVASLRGKSIAVPEQAAWRIIGKGGNSIRKLEKDSGGAWIRVQTAEKPHTVEIFGEGAAVERAETLLKERHAHASVEIAKDSVARIIGRGGANLRELEAASGGAQLYVETAGEPHTVEIIGEAATVERALALLRERLATVRVEVPRRVIPYVIGKKGANLREVETASGASLNVLSESEPCFVELSGSRASTDKARQLVERLVDQHSYDCFEVSRDVASHVAGRRGAALREVESSTGASVRVDLSRETCLVEVFGEKLFVAAAMEALRRRAKPTRLRIDVPRHALAYIVGRAGTGTQEIEAASGALLHVDVQDEETDRPPHCAIEVVGDEEQVKKAEALLSTRTEADLIEVPAYIVPRVIGRGGSIIRSIQVNTGATLHIPSKHGSTCRIEIFGTKESRAAARTCIQELQSPPAPATSTVPPMAALPSQHAWSRPPTQAAQHRNAAIDDEDQSTHLLRDAQIPDHMVFETNAPEQVPWAWRMVAGDLSSPPRAPEALGPKPVLLGPRSHLPEAGGACALDAARQGAKRSLRSEATQLPLPVLRPRWSLSRLSRGILKRKKTSAGQAPVRRQSRRCTKDSESSAPSPLADLLGADMEDDCSTAPRKAARLDELLEAAIEQDRDTSARKVPRLGELIKADINQECTASAQQAPRPPVPAPLRRQTDRNLQHMAHTPLEVAPLVRQVPLTLSQPAAVQPIRQMPGSLQHLPTGPCAAAPAGRQELHERRQMASTRHETDAPALHVRLVSPARQMTLPVATDRATAPEKARGAGLATASAPAVLAPTRPPTRASHQRVLATAPAPAAGLIAAAPKAVESATVARCNTAATPRGPAPLFGHSAHAAAAWATALPTPARGPQKRERPEEQQHPEPETAGLRNVRRKLPKPALFILDGLNILKFRNTSTWGAGGTGEADLKWDQLERVCRFYTCRGQQVSVYLPPLRSGHEDRLERCREEFGDIFVSCCTASDDRFMINTVKLYDHGNDASTSEPACRIVTNDRFEDWKRRGDVDDVWVDRYCVRFAFGPAGFVPSELI